MGDGPDVPSGFGRATKEICASLDYRLGGLYDVTVLGINANGDPGTVPYPVFTCWPGGDMFGIGRLIWMCDKSHPDVIVLQNDPWNIQPYVLQLERFPEYKRIPVIAELAVDGLNIRAGWLRGLAHAIFWTEFAKKEARKGGYTGPASVIPLGVDLKTFYPEDKQTAKQRRIPTIADAFVVGNVNRNQPRKRWDSTIKLFAEWIHSRGITDAFLYLHTAPTGDVGIDVKDLAKYYSVLDHLALMEPPTFYGIPEAEMRETYNCFDVCITTTQGEGMGLTTMEAMACGVPCIVPTWAALGDWAEDAAWQVKCSSTCIGSPWVNVIGGVPDEALFIEALDALYRDKGLRESWGMRGLSCMQESRYRWPVIGQAWLKVLEGVLGQKNVPAKKITEVEWADLGQAQEVV